ncbi:hypothetical protein ES708_16660 [subsurface metagenome]
MNLEQLIDEAKIAVKQFRRLHNCHCFLKFSGGKVQALSARDAPRRYPQSLFISIDEQKKGLSNLQWKQIAQSLLTQCKNEISCQNHPKP